MEAVCFSETLAFTYKYSRRYNSQYIKVSKEHTASMFRAEWKLFSRIAEPHSNKYFNVSPEDGGSILFSETLEFTYKSSRRYNSQDIKVSKEHTVSMFRAEWKLFSRIAQPHSNKYFNVSPEDGGSIFFVKRWYIPTSPHGVTTSTSSPPP
jgi:hypothetical protein